MIRKFFGRRGEPHQPTPEQGDTPEVRERRLEIKGELPPTPFTPEYRRRTTPITAYEYRHGKLVQYRKGPILPTIEHAASSLTRGFPRNCAPSESSLFFHSVSSDSINRIANTWGEGAGEVVKTTIRTREGQQYTVIAQRHFIPEDGVGGRKRTYTEMHALMIPDADWSITVIPQMMRLLDANSVTERNFDADPVSIDTQLLDAPLATDWFTPDIEELLVRIISGKSVSLQSRHLSQDEFIHQLFHCLACLPERVARQVSFGAGLASTNDTDGDVRISQSYFAKAATTKIGDRWRGEEALTEQLKLGQEYLGVIRPLIANCTTPRQVLAMIATRVPAPLRQQVEARFQT